MGLCHDPVDGVGIETRSESFCLTSDRPKVGIYAYADDSVEITYEFLAAFIRALRQVDNPEIQRALGPAAGSPSSETERIEFLESKLGLHEGIEMVNVVDGYEVALTSHDGATTTKYASGPTLLEAIDALRSLSTEEDRDAID